MKLGTTRSELIEALVNVGTRRNHCQCGGQYLVISGLNESGTSLAGIVPEVVQR